MTTSTSVRADCCHSPLIIKMTIPHSCTEKTKTRQSNCRQVFCAQNRNTWNQKQIYFYLLCLHIVGLFQKQLRESEDLFDPVRSSKQHGTENHGTLLEYTHFILHILYVYFYSAPNLPVLFLSIF